MSTTTIKLQLDTSKSINDKAEATQLSPGIKLIANTLSEQQNPDADSFTRNRQIAHSSTTNKPRDFNHMY
jgi:hypothetical protein